MKKILQFHSTPTSKPSDGVPTQTHANSDGTGQSKEKNRAVPFSRSEMEAPAFNDFWRNLGQQVNDNPLDESQSLTMGGLATMVLTGLLLALAVMSLNSSAVMTALVMHTDSRVLSAAMDVNPDLVGAVLNEVNIGE